MKLKFISDSNCILKCNNLRKLRSVLSSFISNFTEQIVQYVRLMMSMTNRNVTVFQHHSLSKPESMS